MNLIEELIKSNPCRMPYKVVGKPDQSIVPYLTLDSDRESRGFEDVYFIEVRLGAQFSVDPDIAGYSNVDLVKVEKERAVRSIQNMLYGEVVSELREIARLVSDSPVTNDKCCYARSESISKILELIRKLEG